MLATTLHTVNVSYTAVSSTNHYHHQCRLPFRITCCVSPVPVQQQEQLPSQIKLPLPPPQPPSTGKKPAVVDDCDLGSGIQVPRQRHISVSKSRLLDAIVSSMFPSEDEATDFRSLSQCLDSILHAEHKSILEEMRADFDSLDDFRSPGSNFVANKKGLGLGMDDEAETAGSVSRFKFTLNWRKLLGPLFRSDMKNPESGARVLIPIRFQRAFMQLLRNAEFEELSSRDLLLSSALNTDYLLTLPIYVDWRRASESGAIVFRRGYASERQKGLLIGEKLDYLQSKLLQKFFLLFAKPLRELGGWLNEVLQSMNNDVDTEAPAYKLSLWLKEFALSLKSHSYNEQILDDLQGPDILSGDDPIWVAAQKAVTRYEGIFSTFGPRERLLRKFLTWTGLVPSAPQEAFNLDIINSGSNTDSSPSFLSRISLSDIWKPASPKCCGNDFRKMIGTALSILTSQSVLQEPAFQELILLYTDEIGESETADNTEVSLLQMEIYEKIPIPDLPVVFPHKKLSFRIIDTVRLDVATILGLSAYFLSYKFEDILSSPSAILLDVIAASALVIYASRVLLGYKQTRDRYQLLVNRTLYEKTIASGFGSIHFLLDASEQQLYKEAIMVYASLLNEDRHQVTNTRALKDKCERFLSSTFEEKIEMPIDKAIETLKRVGLVSEIAVNGQCILQAVRCSKGSVILRNRWNSLIN